MQFLILAAGKPSLGYAKEGVELYLNRLRPFGKTELKLVRDGNSQDVSKRLLAASEGCLRIAMDERGELWTTKKLVDLAKDWQMHSVRRIAFLIGASDGHTEELRSRCNHIPVSYTHLGSSTLTRLSRMSRRYAARSKSSSSAASIISLVSSSRALFFPVPSSRRTAWSKFRL